MRKRKRLNAGYCTSPRSATVSKLFFAAILLFPCLVWSAAATPPTTAAPIRLGWQTPWATQGQLVMGLKHTNIPALTGIRLQPIGFSYGAPLNSAALAGEVDVLLTADQPALVLLSKTDQFAIVARMMYNRVCVYVPPGSPVHSVAELKGKRVMGPVGAAAERVALQALKEAGLGAGDVAYGSLDMAPQAALLRRAGRGAAAWPGVDALYGFDPLPAVFEAAGEARMLSCGNVVSVVLASRKMIAERPRELQAFLAAFALSWHFYATHPREANAWFADEARLDVTGGGGVDAVLDQCAAVEPNRAARELSGLRLTFDPADLKTLDAALAFLRDKGVVREPLDIRQRIDLKPLAAALADPRLAGLAKQVRPVDPVPQRSGPKP
jgi:ABC-type nitrate/sulfonate/bicarbonate transport system substrate-binding protein